jgi:hypothetical protein
MSALAIGGVTFICLSFAVVAGIFLRDHLPEHHLSTDSKEAIKLATAVVGTLSALAVGFFIASAKTAFDDAEAELRTSVARVVLLDRVMSHYGPETKEARRLLAELVSSRLQDAWVDQDHDDTTPDARRSDLGIEPVQDELRALSPETDAKRQLQARAIAISGEIAEAHWLLLEKGGEGLPQAFLVILVFWLALLFFTFGLLAPANATVIGMLFVCALSVGGAIFLIIDMAHPYLGIIQVSDAPLRTALAHLGRN